MKYRNKKPIPVYTAVILACSLPCSSGNWYMSLLQLPKWTYVEQVIIIAVRIVFYEL